MPYEVRALADNDGCNALSLGATEFVPLKNFLRKEAKRLHKASLAKTFVLVEVGHSRVLAYVTLVCTQVAVQQLGVTAPVDGYKYLDYPAVKLARLAVDTSLKGQGVGSQLVEFAVALAERFIMPHAGCRFLVVDSKPIQLAFTGERGLSAWVRPKMRMAHSRRCSWICIVRPYSVRKT